MENASKALIIAGSILLAILLISLGIFIFRQATANIDSISGLSEAEAKAFNSKFTKYEGQQKGSTIRAMVQEVMANNNNEDASIDTQVTINSGNTSNVVSLGSSIDSNGNKSVLRPTYKNLKNTETYNVTCEYTKGRVTNIIVESNN